MSNEPARRALRGGLRLHPGQVFVLSTDKASPKVLTRHKTRDTIWAQRSGTGDCANSPGPVAEPDGGPTMSTIRDLSTPVKFGRGD